ncbi:hypothetical protein ACIPW5_11160 [Streptomyces sp. NPDC090077]|uniref:hypothetical protein n=1 Tax=Streptomyces sp. NPDC090077 TaxID=3365938 RepID=UPI003823A72F
MADLLPADTTSPRLAGLPPVTALDVPAAVVEAEARRLQAEHNLRKAALAAGMTANEYRKAGLLAEQRHQYLDLDVDSTWPCPYLPAGGQS